MESLSLRARLKAGSLAAKEQGKFLQATINVKSPDHVYTLVGERYHLVFWQEEDTVSIHSDAEVNAEASMLVLHVQFNSAKKITLERLLVVVRLSCYVIHYSDKSERIVLGSKAEMIAREKEYISGQYTPFQIEEPEALVCSEGMQVHV